MDWWTMRLPWMLAIGLLLGLLAPITSNETPCDTQTHFRCRSDPTLCISLMRVRDGSPDCPDKSDEECNPEVEFQCQSIHQCIPKERIHDGWPDCDDGSDEECTRSQFRCRCGLPRCIEGHRVKDGIKDCDDGSDEMDKPETSVRCPDENRLQDLLAVERRKKRQIDVYFQKLDEAPSTSKDPPHKRYLQLFRYVAPSRSIKLNDSFAFDTQPNRNIFKVSTETEVYGSLISGNVYQTAVSEPLSSMASPKYTKPADGYGKASSSENLGKHKKGKIHFEKDILRKLKIKPSKTIKVEREEEEHILDNFDNSKHKILFDNSRSRTRKLLSLDTTNAKDKHYHKRRSPVENTPLLSSSSTEPSRNLYPTGLVTSMTGTDIIDGKTTEWTTIIEGTYISGTYAHVVRSTSKIFLTVTKTLTDVAIAPSKTEKVDSTEVGGLQPSSTAEKDIEELAIKDSSEGLIGSFRPTARILSAVSSTEQSNGDDAPMMSSTVTISASDQPMESSVELNENHTTVKTPSTVESDVKVLTPLNNIPLLDINNTSPNVADLIEDNSSTDGSQTNVGLITKPPTFFRNEKSSENEDAATNIEEPTTTTDQNDMLTSNAEISRSSNDEVSITGNMANESLADENNKDFSIAGYTKSSEEIIEHNDYQPTTSSSIKISSKEDEIIEADIAKTELVDSIMLEKSIDVMSNEGAKSNLGQDINEPTSLFVDMPLEPSVVFLQASSSLVKTVSLFSSMEERDNTDANMPVSLIPIDNEESSNTNLQGTFSDMDSTPADLGATFLSEDTKSSLNLETDEVKRVKRVVNNPVTVLNPDGRIVTTNADILLTPTTHYTTYTYYTTVLRPGGGTRVISNLHVDSSVIHPRIDGHIRPQTTRYNHPVADDGSCCHTTIYEGNINNPVVIRDGEGFVGIPIDDRRHTSYYTQPLDIVRPATHRTTYTYFTTVLRAGSPVVHTRYVTETDLPFHAPDVHDYTRRQSIPLRFGGIDPIHTHVIDTRLNRPSQITHTTTYTYLTTVYRQGTPIVNTREETEVRVTQIPTYNSPTYYTTTIREIPDDAIYTHRIDPNLYRPSSVTHRTTYTYHTTRIRDGIPIVNTREVTDTNITPIPTHRHRPIPTRITTYDTVHHDHGVDEPYITHRTTYTYYTTRFRGGTSFIDTRKEIATNITPNPTYGYNRGRTTTYIRPAVPYHTEYYDECVACQDANRALPRIPADDHDHHDHDGRNRPNVVPSDVTHFTTYTYATTELPRNAVPMTRTRQHTVTEIHSHAVLPSVLSSTTQEYRFGDRIRSKRTISDEKVLVPSTENTDRVAGEINIENLKYNKNPELLKHIYNSKVKIHTSDDSSSSSLKDYKSSPKASYKKLRKDDWNHHVYDKRKLLAINPDLQPSYENPIALPNEDLVAAGAEAAPIVVTPITYFTTHTYYSTILKPGGQTVVQTNTEVFSSVHHPTPQETQNIPPNRRVRKNRRKKIIRNGTVPIKPDSELPKEDAINPSRTRKIIRTRVRKIRVRQPAQNTNLHDIYTNKNSEKASKHRSSYRPEIDYTTEIRPTRVTFLTTYTYFTTELQNGQRVIKSREHTVTEILSDVVVPTVLAVGDNRRQQPYNPHQRFKRDKSINLNHGNGNKLLNTMLSSSFDVAKAPNYTLNESVTKVINTLNSRVSYKKLYMLQPSEKSKNANNVLLESSTDFHISKAMETRAMFDLNDDLQAEGAEIHSAVILTPTTHYTTHTYYTTVLKPGGSKVVESNVQVSSSVYYPNSVDSNWKKYQSRERYYKPNDDIVKCKSCVLNHDTSSYSIYRPRFQQPLHLENHKQKTQISHRKPINHLRTTHYVTSLPVRRMSTYARRIPDRALNTVDNAAIKPTHVTYYSTYTYFTTELEGGKPVIKSREHTVTEVLTDVVVPTVVPVRGKRDIDIVNTGRTRKLLGVTESDENVIDYETTEDSELMTTNDQPVEELESVTEIAVDIKESSKEDSFILLGSVNNDIDEPSISQPSTVIATPVLESSAINKNAEVSEAFDAYLSYLKFGRSSIYLMQSGGVNETTPETTSDEMGTTSSNFFIPASITPRKIPTETMSNIPLTSGFTSTISTDVTKNGKITRYTTTIYGTYINGFHAQRAISESQVVSLPEMTDNPKSLEISPMYSPSRSEGLVSIKVSKVTRGPLAIHFTTEIYGTYVAGAYAQTARIFTSYQRLSATTQKESTKQRIHTTSSTAYSGPRKTGLLSSQVLRTQIMDGTTLLLVSEIHGTHIGGAYAHLGTYVTRTIAPANQKTAQPTYKADELKTGLITSSVSDKIFKGTTTRYHYEVYGTFLDGIYAHVPSASKEIIRPDDATKLEIFETTSYVNDNLTGRKVPDVSHIMATAYDSPSSLQIGLIEVSSRVHAVNGTTTKYIYEVHGTYLDGMYAHVPSISRQVIEPTTTQMPVSSPITLEVVSSTTDFSDENGIKSENEFEGPLFDDDDDNLSAHLLASDGNSEHDLETMSLFLYNTDDYLSSSEAEDIKKTSSQIKLLPAELRVSYRNNYKELKRSKRNKPNSWPFLYSSFQETSTDAYVIDGESRTPGLTTPVLDLSTAQVNSIFVKYSADIVQNQEMTKSMGKLKKHKLSTLKKQPKYQEINKVYRFKRSPQYSKPSSTTSKRFGMSNTDARKFRPSTSSTYKRNFEKAGSTRPYIYSKSPNSASTYKNLAETTKLPLLTKRPPLFPARNRGRSISATTTVETSTISSISEVFDVTPSMTSSRKFGKFSSPNKRFESVDDFDASEAVLRSVTDDTTSPSTRRSRYPSTSRPIKSKSLGGLSVASNRRNFNSKSTASRASNTNYRTPSLRGFRNRLSKVKSTATMEEIQPTMISIEESNTAKKRFTLTTSSYSIKLKPTSSFLMSMEDSEENNLNDDNVNKNTKRKFNRNNRRNGLKSSINNDENEVHSNRAKSLPLPPFGRSRGFKRPSTFDPRTLKESTTSSATSTIIYITNTPTPPILIDRMDLNDDELFEEEFIKNTPVTITSVITTTKTLAVHLGQRTSYATITTTAYSTSVILPDDLTTVSADGITRTIVSTVLGLPDNNLPADQRKTLKTEYFLTTTEMDTTSLLAIKTGYGTRTDTIIARQILTTLATQVSTLQNLQTSSAVPLLPQYPYFPNPYLLHLNTPNPFIPPYATTNPFHQLQLINSQLSFIDNENFRPPHINDRNIFVTPFVETVAMETSQVPNPSLTFLQQAFVLPSVTTPVTVHFTADNGEVISIVTLVTVPLITPQAHSRVLRSVSTTPYPAFTDFPRSSFDLQSSASDTLTLQSSFKSHYTDSKNFRENKKTQIIDKFEKTSLKHKLNSSKFPKYISKSMNDERFFPSFNNRKLLQVVETSVSEDDSTASFDKDHSNSAASPIRVVEDSENSESVLDDDPGTIDRDDFLLDSFLIGSDDGFARPIPSVRVAPTRRAYVRRIRPGNTQPQPIPDEPFRNVPIEAFALPQNPHNFQPQRFSSNRLQQPPFALNYPEEPVPFIEQPQRLPERRPVVPDSNSSPNNRRLIRLRRPGAVPVPLPVPQQDPGLLERKPIVNSPPANEYGPLRARGPVVVSNNAPVQNIRDSHENDLRRRVPERHVVPSQILPSTPLPLTYYTTFTYMTTFLNGPSTAYSTREAIVSNVATETLNPTLVDLIRYRGGFTTAQGAQTAVPLGSRAHGPSTTVVNLASRVQVYNSDVYYSQPDVMRPNDRPIESKRDRNVETVSSVINTLPITDIASLPKTYYTLFTYYYTLHDGDKSTYSQRSEIVSDVATDAEPFLKQTFSGSIDNSGYLTLSPEREVVNLGSRAAAGMTTEVNLEIRTLVHFDNLRNVALTRPTLVEILPTASAADDTNNNYLEPGDAEVQDQNTYPQTLPIDPSFSAGSSQNSGYGGVRNSNAETPLLPQDVLRTQPLRGPVRVASTKVQRPGSVRSGVYVPRPGVRVRVRPVTSQVVPDESPELESSQVAGDKENNYVDNDEYEELDHDIAADEEEEDITEEETEDNNDSGQSRRRLKITIRRPPDGGSSFSPTRTRPRFYVVTRTGTPGPVRPGGGIRPVSVKVSRRPRPTEQPRYETFTTVSTVPVIFGLSTTFRNVIVTTSSLVPPRGRSTLQPITPSKTLVLTYFTTTTYTVPFTVLGRTSYTTFEETNSRVATETVDSEADLSFVSTTVVNDLNAARQASSESELKKLAKTLSPVQVYNKPQTFNVGNRPNLVTRVSNGVTLIMATDGRGQPPEQPTGTLEPTVLIDTLLMIDKDFTTIYQPRTFYTTFTFFTTFFSGGTPSISTSEQVVTNIYTIPITRPIKTDMTITTTPELVPVTLVDTTEQIVSTTVYKTHTLYATLFNGSETIVTPIEELQPSVISSTETFTITKTVLSPLSASPEIKITRPVEKDFQTTTTTMYRTRTNYVTLFRGPESIISALEELVPEVITLTLDKPSNAIQPTAPAEAIYTTRTIQETNTHYVTLFSGGEQILSSITEVTPSFITELVYHVPTDTTLSDISEPQVHTEAPNVPTYQDLVPSVRTEYTTLTYFTTLYQDSSTILSSREEIATSYVTLFVPVPAGTDKPKQQIIKTVERTTSTVTPPIAATPSTEVLTFYTTYTYYTTLFRGTETIISDSETVVTQFVTIDATSTDSIPQVATTSSVSIHLPPSENADIRIESSVTSVTPSDHYINVNFDKFSPEEVSSVGGNIDINPSGISPSKWTGVPVTDANGATHILFTDFIVPDSTTSSNDAMPSSVTATPALPEDILSPSAPKQFETTRSSTANVYDEYFDTSQRRETVSDMATTRVTDANVVTHMPFRPTTAFNGGSSQTFGGIKPGAVIDLSDVLGNTNLVGNLGETIKDIVNLFAAGNRHRNSSSDQKPTGGELNVVGPIRPSGGVPVNNAEEPLYIPIGAIGRGTTAPAGIDTRPVGINRPPATILTGFTPVSRQSNNQKTDENLRAQEDKISNVRTSLVFGTNTIFIDPTMIVSSGQPTQVFGTERTMVIRPDNSNLFSSRQKPSNFGVAPTPVVVTTDSTSVITGVETIFFALPDKRLPSRPSSQQKIVPSRTSSIVGVETIFFDHADNIGAPGNTHITGETTIFGSFPVILGSKSSAISNLPSFTESTRGATTIFFPIGDGDKQRPTHPGTRYVTSVQSVTLTLTLTTSSVYQSQDKPVTMTSVFTTTIPPRTFVSTIIGSRTILGTQPEPTEAVQVIPTLQSSESTTTVTTTTLIFNSIATTVVRTLVIPTQALKPTDTAVEASTIPEILAASGGDDASGTSKPASANRKPIQLFKSANRPTSPATTRKGPTGPPVKLFPTKPSTTTTNAPPPRQSTTKKTGFRKPGKALVPATDGCATECNLKNKEVCKQNPDRSWSCQCRPGFFKKKASDECRDVKSYTVLVRVLQMPGNEVLNSEDYSDSRSVAYQNLTTTARKAVDEAYKLSSVGENYINTNVLGVSPTDRKLDGVLVNLTVTLTGDKPTSEVELKDELAQSLQVSASEAVETNTTFVSAIIQKVEDVQDFDECADDTYNDCSRSSTCINLPGTYTCSCREGYQDLEPLLPGRICSGEIQDCDFCNNRGVCIMTEDDQKFCRCYRMYLGKQCEINGLVLAIALPIALALLILTMFCLLCGCRKLRRHRTQKSKVNVFKGMAPPMAGTLDRKAMIMDSSSESSNDHAKVNHGYDAFAGDGGNQSYRREGRRSRSNSIEDRISEDYGVPTVVIPRARHQHSKQVNNYPSQPSSYHRTHSPYDDHW